MNPVQHVADTDFDFSSLRLRSEMALQLDLRVLRLICSSGLGGDPVTQRLRSGRASSGLPLEQRVSVDVSGGDCHVKTDIVQTLSACRKYVAF